MSDESRHTSESSWATMALLVALPLLYILSVGPVVFALEKFHAMSSPFGQSLRTFYTPVIWLHDHTSLKQTLESYTEWWQKLARRH